EVHRRTGRYTASLRELDFASERFSRYLYGFSGQGAEGVAIPENHPVKPSDLPAGTGAGKDHFRAGAAGRPDTRTNDLDVWIIDESGTLENVSNACEWTRFLMFKKG